MFENDQGQIVSGPATFIFSVSNKEKEIFLDKAKYAINAGDTFPPSTLKTLDEKTLDNRELTGRYTLVNFFFADCAPCIQELPLLNAFAEKIGISS
ncbi:TlpA disulfide reductase family protein [Undibacterium sp. RTI2.1]|nr:TlpA disulfide reductase family protein [Undibacterium sp. RTI2.1]MEB0032700.1 TlpA disulfide reductase family protein [Undibacterium sp. RTI2.1]